MLRLMITAILCGALPAGAFQPGVVLSVLGTWDIIVAALPAPALHWFDGATGQRLAAERAP